MDEAAVAVKDAGLGHATLVVQRVNEGAMRLHERRDSRKTGETAETWSEPMLDGKVQPVERASSVMRKEL
jgi:hypothetical protein